MNRDTLNTDKFQKATSKTLLYYLLSLFCEAKQ